MTTRFLNLPPRQWKGSKTADDRAKRRPPHSFSAAGPGRPRLSTLCLLRAAPLDLPPNGKDRGKPGKEVERLDRLKLDVRARWQGESKTAVRIRDFPPLYMDEPPAMGGDNAGPSPMEYVLAALCGCTAVILRMVAGEIGVAVTSLELAAEGTIDPRGFKGDPKVREHFQKVDEKISLTTDASPGLVETLKKEWADRCPAYNLLKDAGVEMSVEWEIRRPT